jgi:acetyl esterase/lipase
VRPIDARQFVVNDTLFRAIEPQEPVVSEFMQRAAGILMIFLLVSPMALGQAQSAKTRPRNPKPTVPNYAYGKDSERQVLDFWQAKSDKPTPLVLMIHGGGWVGGNKERFRGSVQEFLDAGISVATINYRLIKQAMEQKVDPPVKASLYDAARALQTIRSKAKEWNIDPNRIAATGGSAGACTSLWLALHNDLAKPDSADPIARQSTRLTCAAVVGAQTSLDPVAVREWIPNARYGGHAFGLMKESKNGPATFQRLLDNREKLLPLIQEYSPIEHVSKDDPPIYLDYPKQKIAPKAGQKENDPTHSAMYGVKLAEELRKAGVEVVLSYPQEPETIYGSPAKFMIEKLRAGRPAK